MASTTHPEQPASLEARVAHLERLLETQQARITEQQAEMDQQRAEITRLRATPAAPMPPRLPALPALAARPESAAPPAPEDLPAPGADQPAKRNSRRALLKLGGAAAAAGVAAAAAAATELAHPGTAEAAVTWSTGNVLADQETDLIWGSNLYSGTNMLTVQFGIDGIYEQAIPSRTAIEAYNAMLSPTAPAYAVYATSHVGEAIHGACDSGIGVAGTSVNNMAVRGTSTNETGVGGLSTNQFGGYFQGGLAPLYLVPSGSAGAPTSGGHIEGELYVDSNGVLWYSTAGVTWVRLTGVVSGVPGGALNYLPAPIRIYDTRSGSPAPLPVSKGALSGNTAHTIQVTGTDVGGIHVPAGAAGVFGNLTVTNTSGPGDLILWPHGATQPTTSNINYSGGQTVANSVNVGLSADGKMSLFVHVSTTDVIFDVAGYVL
ncbi:MAG TPA: SlyX family protein [Ktedonobacterales bacterium]|nr:SlyX family protein [Ktedonobacterales bacterium]